MRLISRRLHRGAWKRLQLDDFLIICAMVRICAVSVSTYTDHAQTTDTILLVYMAKVVRTSSNLIPPNVDISEFSQAEINSRILGSKYVLVVEQMQIATIWLVKACLLIMYFRMTTVLPQRKLVVATSIYVAVAFVIMEILYFGVWCRPFNQYWAVPPNSSECVSSWISECANGRSTMLCCDKSSDHQRCLQHQFRSSYPQHTDATPFQSPIALEEQADLDRHLHDRNVHC